MLVQCCAIILSHFSRLSKFYFRHWLLFNPCAWKFPEEVFYCYYYANNDLCLRPEDKMIIIWPQFVFLLLLRFDLLGDLVTKQKKLIAHQSHPWNLPSSQICSYSVRKTAVSRKSLTESQCLNQREERHQNRFVWFPESVMNYVAEPFFHCNVVWTYSIEHWAN